MGANISERERGTEGEKKVYVIIGIRETRTHTHTHTHTSNNKKSTTTNHDIPPSSPFVQHPLAGRFQGRQRASFFVFFLPPYLFLYIFAPAPKGGAMASRSGVCFWAKLAGDTCGREEGERIFYFDLSNSSDIPQTGGGKRLSERRIFFPSSPRPSIFYFT